MEKDYQELFMVFFKEANRTIQEFLWLSLIFLKIEFVLSISNLPRSHFPSLKFLSIQLSYHLFE